MIIYKSDDIEKWNEVMTSDIDGTRFHCKNPRTGEIDHAFELNRTTPQILEDTGKCAKEMFEIIWNLQETYNKVDDVNRELRNRFNLSKIETQNMMIYFHLSLPKRENGHPMRLETWKKCRNREQIWQDYLLDNSSSADRINVVSEAYFMKDIITKGKINFSAMFDLISRPDFANIINNCNEPIKKTEPDLFNI